MKDLPLPGSPGAPQFWMYETSGLQPIVRKYLAAEDLSVEECSWLRAYLRQWINADVWAPSPDLTTLRVQVDLLTSRIAIDLWTKAAFDLCIDPW